MAKDLVDCELPLILRDTITSLVRRHGPDLSARQFGVFLICYLRETPQSVRGLALEMSVSKPAISRVLDRLAEFDLVCRKPDPTDGRGMFVGRTLVGSVYMRDLRAIMSASVRRESLTQKRLMRL